MKQMIKYFCIFSFLMVSQISIAAETKKWQDTQLVIVELSPDLKPVDKKEVKLDKPFNASNDIFKIDFSYFVDEKSLDRKLNIQADNISVLQRFTSPEQSLNWTTQIKLSNGKTYYFMVNKTNTKK